MILKSGVMKIWPVMVWCVLAGMSSSFAQKAEREAAHDHAHRFTVMMMNAHIPNMSGINDQDKFAVVPAWGLDYDFWFNERWAIGLHSNLILQQYKIRKEHEQVVIERSYPIASCAVGIFKPLPRLSAIAGAGAEFEREENFFMYKLGLEYGFELPRQFELSINLLYDNKIDAYDTWFFGLGISKSFRGRHRP